MYRDLRYKSIWEQFSANLHEFYESLYSIEHIKNNRTLHDIVDSAFEVPYHCVREAFTFPEATDTANNIGSLTGVFFEQLVAATIIPYIKQKCQPDIIARNKCSNAVVSSIASCPDIYIAKRHSNAVIEIKVSPKRSDFLRVSEYRKRYNQIGVHYYFIGGYASIGNEYIEEFDASWTCVFKNVAVKYSLDDLVKNITKEISDSESNGTE